MRWAPICRLAVAVMAMLVPAVFLVYGIIFPARVFLERDLQLNGRKSAGQVVALKVTETKRHTPVYHCRVRFNGPSRAYEAWVLCDAGAANRDVVPLLYAPSFPRYATAANTPVRAWDENLLLRSLATLFLVFVSAGVMVGVYRRFAGRHKGGDRTPGVSPWESTRRQSGPAPPRPQGRT
jgi:hypothetical protein